MNYWLTTHWPRFESDPTSEVEPGVWLQENAGQVGAGLDTGDIVFIYQAKSGLDLVETTASGMDVRKRRRVGRAGIVAVATAVGPFGRQDDRVALERYANGTPKCWRWHAPLKVRSMAGFLPLAKVLEVLGQSPAYTFRAFGDRHSGLKRLRRDQHDQVLEAFLRNRTTLPKPPRPGHPQHGEGGVESDTHRYLKLHVAAHPAEVLGEPGLKTLSVEYQFPTEDRADVVLEDGYGRVIGLEVEVHCGPKHVAGILQAVKYRRMLEVLMGRPHGDGRAMLVAHSVCSQVCDICKRYDVEVRVVPRAAVPKALHA